jgi:UDPglucose 6-dehydrogenase
VPTPMSENGTCNTYILENILNKLKNTKCGIIVIKSTIPPNILKNLNNLKIVYNPEFLTEKNANEDIINPSIQVFGGQKETTEKVEQYYKEYSICKPCPTFHMSLTDASFVKYGINCFLATKVLWYNELYDAVDKFGGNFGKIINAIGTDPRIGQSHTRVPGFDGKRGFGGACFPKDLSAWINFTNSMPILEYVIKKNNTYRLQYEKDDREKEQNVSYE